MRRPKWDADDVAVVVLAILTAGLVFSTVCLILSCINDATARLPL